MRRAPSMQAELGGSIERQLAAVCVRIEQTPGHSLPERRIAQLRMQAFGALREPIASAGGAVLGAAGATLFFCVGYPQAQENNCEHAVRLLMEFWQAPRDEALALTAGVDCGSLLLSSGTPVFASGAAIDEALNIAEHAEPGSISLSLGAQTLVRRFFRFAPSVKELRGRARSTQLYRVIEAIPHELGIELVSTTPLQSRTPQIEKLDRAFFDAGQKAIVTRLIVGDAGVGKSRLLHEWRKGTGEAADSILTAYGTSYEQASPFAPLLRLWRSWFGLHLVEGADAARARVENVLEQAGIASTSFAQALEYVLEIAAPENPLLGMPSERRRGVIVEAFVSLFTALAETRLMVLIVEDVHFIDRSTLEVLQRLVESPHPATLLILLTARPEFLSSWSLAERIARVEVERLSPTEALRLVESIAQRHSLPPATCRRLIELGDGVPLVLEELTRAVVSDPASDGAEPYQLSNCPTSLADSVAMRLEALGPAKELICVAAALGRETSLDLLRAAVPIGPEEFRTRLHKLTAANLVHLRKADGHDFCVFSHALVQGAVNQSAAPAESIALHARIAAVLDADFHELVEAAPGRFAHIYAKAMAYSRALELCEQAAQRAIESSAYHEASAHLQAALSFLQQSGTLDAERERRLRYRLGPCLGAIEGWSSSAVADNLSRTYALGGANAELRELLGLWAHGLVTHDADKVRSALSTLNGVPGSPQQRFVTYTMQGVTAFYRGQFSLARKALEQAVAMLPPLTGEPGAGDFVDLADAREWGCEFSVAASLHLCWLEALSERRPRLLALLEQAERLLIHQSSDAEQRELRHGLYMRIHLGLTLGDYELYGYSQLARAEGPLHRMFELAGTKFPYYRCVAQIGEMRARVAEGEVDAIDELVAAYDRMKALSRRPTGHVFLSTIVAEACLEVGDPARAQAFISDALEIGGSEFARFFAPEAHRVAACQRLSLLDFKGAQDELRRARSACIALDAPSETPPRLFEQRLQRAEQTLRERALKVG
ncbi:MAG: AAA family ATPase [Polyangiaceae bacterium]